MKALIFDSGPLINFSMNGLLPVLEQLKKTFKGAFLITKEVEEEVYDHPIKVHQFELGALRIESLVKNNTLEFSDKYGISASDLAKETKRLTMLANSAYDSEGEKIQIVSEAEMSCIALSKMLEKKNNETIIAVDERTARLLGEKPDNLERLMSSKLHKPVKMNPSLVKEFKNLRFIRSSEIAYVAYKKGLINLKDPKALEALIYATKFKGAAISWDEIDILKKL